MLTSYIAVLDTGIRCYRFHWTTADTGACMKVVYFTTQIFAVHSYRYDLIYEKGLSYNANAYNTTTGPQYN